MTTTEIREQLNAVIDAFEIVNCISPNQTLISAENTTLTDDLAMVLETVNPTNNYPPVLK